MSSKNKVIRILAGEGPIGQPSGQTFNYSLHKCANSMERPTNLLTRSNMPNMKFDMREKKLGAFGHGSLSCSKCCKVHYRLVV